MADLKRARVAGLPKAEPWKPADWEPEDAYALQAVMLGRASEDQQRRAMKFIVENICGAYDLSFRPGATGDRETVFAEGKRHVALQLIKFATLNIAAVRSRNSEQGSPSKHAAAPKEQPT